MTHAGDLGDLATSTASGTLRTVVTRPIARAAPLMITPQGAANRSDVKAAGYVRRVPGAIRPKPFPAGIRKAV